MPTDTPPPPPSLPPAALPRWPEPPFAPGERLWMARPLLSLRGPTMFEHAFVTVLEGPAKSPEWICVLNEKTPTEAPVAFLYRSEAEAEAVVRFSNYRYALDHLHAAMRSLEHESSAYIRALDEATRAYVSRAKMRTETTP